MGLPCDVHGKGDICTMELWAPWYRNEDCTFHQGTAGLYENEAFTMFAMECEGDLLTRRGKINKVIKLLVAAGPEDCTDFDVQCAIYDSVGIDSDTFTDDEVKYIEEEVTKRL